MPILSLGFVLGVLATALAGLLSVGSFLSDTPRARAERAAAIVANYQDSTIK